MWPFLESTIDSIIEPLDEKPGDFSRFLIGEDFPVADACGITAGLPGAHGHNVRLAVLNTYEAILHHRPRARSHTPTAFFC